MQVSAPAGLSILSVAGEERALLYAGGLLALLTGTPCFLFSGFSESYVFPPRKEEVVPTAASEVPQGMSWAVKRVFEPSPKLPSS